MFSPNSIKFFFPLAVVLSFSSSCGWWKTKGEAPPQPPLFAAEELETGIPFSTAEPENFQAEFVVTANNRESRTFFARDGDRRRYDYNFGAKNQLTVLQIDGNRSYLIVPAKKIYAENFRAENAGAPPPTDVDEFLTAQWLNRKADALFTNLGAENGFRKFAVRLNDEESAETIVFVDEKINLPIRQEFYSGVGERKALTFTFETRNFKTPIADFLFEIPKDYKKVSPEKLKAAMREENIGDE